ncbi:prolyl oligopeptidase family serine peptidase [Maribacter halichondriae]|uniref:prolyl oligopeptidase family serine peptidase n=1 Tax=Maribacter halichondriae TaxID=2980554 RepID=UPI00235A42C8|nr:prolyl oligopeptidase family serine peptidase [Maribacter sp. Hal144]
MFKKRIIFMAFFMILPFVFLMANPNTDTKESTVSNPIDGQYSIIIEVYDWGPAVSEVILSMDENVTEAKASDFEVIVERSAEGVEMGADEAKGSREVIYAYVSDEKGNRVSEGNHISLVLFVGPDHVLGSPIKYIRTNNRGANQWIDYRMTITDTASEKIWNTESGRIQPLIDSFNLTGSFTHNDITLPFASFAPDKTTGKSPLLIWLHGGGEGGNDASIPLIANKAANYASNEIQSIFGGAHVLVPQSPTFWMQSASGEYTRGDTNDIYNEALMALIKNYVGDNPDIDTNRIYVGGCSNGGYMSLKLILEHPDYFAAGYISALAYQNQYISDEQIQKIKDVPIWFVHSKEDQTTKPEETVVPVYNRLIGAGAENVHFSYYDHVIDLSGFYGGDDYRFNGHWSWIYSHANHADFDFDGKPVVQDGRPVTIMEWMATQRKQ